MEKVKQKKKILTILLNSQIDSQSLCQDSQVTSDWQESNIILNFEIYLNNFNDNK